MKKFMYVCMYILFAMSLYAQTGHGRQHRAVPQQKCNVKAMLRSANHAGWVEPDCLRAVANYMNNFPQEKGQYDDVVKRVVANSKARYKWLVDNSKTNAAEHFLSAYNEFAVAYSGKERPCIYYDTKKKKYYDCTEETRSASEGTTGGNTSLQSAVSKQVEKQVSNQTRLLGNLTQAEYAELIKNAPAGKMLPANFKRLAEKVQRATDNHEDLSKFIEVVVQGSSDPKNPRNVPTEVVSLAFMQYASSLAPKESSKLTQYTDDKYPAWVRYAAASAAAEYAYSSIMQNGTEKINTDPKGHLKLRFEQRQTVLDVFKEVYYSLDKSDPSLGLFFKVLKLRAARVFDNPVGLGGDESVSSDSQTEQAGAVVLALPLAGQVATRIGLSELMAGAVSEGLSLAAEGISAASGIVAELAPMAGTAAGGAVLAGGVVYCYGAALNDAYAPLWKQQWINQLNATLAGHAASEVAQEEVVVGNAGNVLQLRKESPVSTGSSVAKEYQTTYVPGNRISAEIPVGYNVAVLPIALMQNLEHIRVVDNEVLSITQAQTATKTKKANRTCAYSPKKPAGTLTSNFQKLEGNFINTGDSETLAAWRRFTGNCLGETPLAECDKEKEQLLEVKKLSASFIAYDAVSNSGKAKNSMPLHVRAVYRPQYGGWIPEAEYPMATSYMLNSMINFVQKFLNVKDSETLLGIAQQIVLGEKFNGPIDGGLFNIRDGLHGKGNSKSFGINNEGFMSDNDKVANKPFSHFHVGHACQYTPQTPPDKGMGKPQDCVPEASVSGTTTETEQTTKTYICNLSFYYCTQPGNALECARSLGVSTPSIKKN